MAFPTFRLAASLPLLLLIAALAFGLYKAYHLWREMNEDDEPVSETDVFAELEKAYYAGEMNEEEFQRVRERLGRVPDARTRRPLHVPPSPTPGATRGSRTDLIPTPSQPQPQPRPRDLPDTIWEGSPSATPLPERPVLPDTIADDLRERPGPED